MIQTLKGRIGSRAESLLLLSVTACVLEGVLRKWIFRDSAGPIKYVCYFAKDFVFAAILLCVARAVAYRRLKTILLIGLPLILIGALLSSVQGLNFVGGLLSLRALIALPVIAYFAIPRLAGIKIDNVAFLIGGLTILNAVLGIKQYSSPVDSAINYYATDSGIGAVAFEENVRAAGTFSYITGYSNFATVGAWAGVSLLCLARGRLRYIVCGWAFYVASLICALVSISRGTVLIVLTMLAMFAVSGKDALGNLFKGLAAAAVLLAAGYALNLNPLFVRLSDTVMERHEMADDSVEGRTIAPFFEAGLATQLSPLGSGFGTEQVAGVYAETGVMSFARFESQFARLVVETGLTGLIGFLITAVGTIYILFRARRSLSDEGSRRILVLSAFLVASFFFTNIAFNHFASYFAWMIVAVTLASVSQPQRSSSHMAPVNPSRMAALPGARA